MRFFGIMIAAIALTAAAGASAATPTFEARTFVATVGAASDVSLDLSIPADQPAAAKVVMYVPAGYGVNTSAPAGTKVATIDAVAQIGGTSLTIPTGDVVADNPANYTSQACAPGLHAAVWVAHAASFTIPIYVDPTSGSEASLGGYKLQVCFTSPDAPGPAAGARLTEAQLNFTKTVLTNPATKGIYLWRVLVTPYVSGTAAPNAGGTFELRSAVFIPATLTIKNGGYSKKTKRVLLSGKFTFLGKPLKGVIVAVFSVSPTGGVKATGHAKTDKKGVYKLRVRVTKTTVFSALVYGGSGPCEATPAAVAPAGCVNETDTSIFANFVRIVPKK